MQTVKPRRLLMTTDAVGGVWRYAVDLARGLGEAGVETTLLGFGPPPAPAQQREAERIAQVVWTDLPLDWMARGRRELAGVPEAIACHADLALADVIQVNLPSQAAGLADDRPVVAAAHSCVASWFRAVRGTGLPDDWAWQHELTRRGLARAGLIIAPSRSFARLLVECYPNVGAVAVVPNATDLQAGNRPREPFAYAAGRWWDEGKNAVSLDATAARCRTAIHVAGAVAGPGGQCVQFAHARQLGPLDRSALVALASSASVFVSPSIYEPFGLAALEAAAAGAALVLSDIPTYRELWDGAALLAAPDDADGFASAVDRLADDPALRRQLVQEAARRVAALTPRAQAGRMLGHYADLMARQQIEGAA